jgi:O-antigen ligase
VGKKISNLILLVVMVTVGICWIPMASILGVVIDVENIGRVFAISLLPLLIFSNKFKVRTDAIIVVLFLWILWTAVLMNLHTGNEGMYLMRMWLVEVLFAFTILNCNIQSIYSLRLITIISVFSLTLIFAYSAYSVGIDLVNETLNYVITQNRSHFLYFTLKGTFNAFSTYTDEYKTVVINKVAATYSLYYCVLLLLPKSNSSIVNTLNIVALIISAIFIVLLFSSSGVLVFVFSSLLYAVKILKEKKVNGVIIIVIFGLMTVSVLAVYVGGDIVDYVMFQVDSDTDSRAGRIVQYTGALNYIMKYPILGVGYKTFDGAPVHNWILFSWLSAGFLSALMAIAVYLLIVKKSLSNSANILYINNDKIPLTYLVMALAFIFLIRSLVGGGGGVVSGAGMNALAIILLYSRKNYPLKIKNNTGISQKPG